MARVVELSTRIAAISRGKGRSATAAAAYRACCAIDCEREGRTHDYSRKGGLVAAEIVLPDGAPAWAKDRASLWNAAELRETNKDKRAKSTEKAKARTAQDYLFTFPDELSADGRLTVARTIAAHLVAAHGVAVDFAIHQPGREGDERNFHCHLMFTTRRMTATGLGEKTREWDDRSRNGGGEPTLAKSLRAFVAGTLNDALSAEGKAGLVFVEHKTFKARGSGQTAQQHQGPKKTHRLRKQQAQARRHWEAEQRQALRDSQAKELASLKLRQGMALQNKIADLAQRGREGAKAIRAELAAQRQADAPPKGWRLAALVVTGRATRDALDRQARDAQRVEATRQKLDALKDGLRAERSVYRETQARERTALSERHGAEERQLRQAVQHRQTLDRTVEVRTRTPANDDRVLTRVNERGARSIGRE